MRHPAGGGTYVPVPKNGEYAPQSFSMPVFGVGDASHATEHNDERRRQAQRETTLMPVDIGY
jgi:hypothetical protein